MAWHSLWQRQLRLDGGTGFVRTRSGTGAGGKVHRITTAYATATAAQLWVARYDVGTLTDLAVGPDGSQVFITGTSTAASGHSQFATVAHGF